MVQSPVENNPYVEIGAGSSPLRLAINTAQFGRTFQVDFDVNMWNQTVIVR